MRRPTRAQSGIVTPPGFVLARGSVLLIVAVILASAAGLTSPESVLLLTVAAATCSVGGSVRIGAALGVIAWFLVTGFVVNSHAELRLSGIEDLVRLLVLVAAPVVVASVPHARRWLHHRRPARVQIRPNIPEVARRDLTPPDLTQGAH